MAKLQLVEAQDYSNAGVVPVEIATTFAGPKTGNNGVPANFKEPLLGHFVNAERTFSPEVLNHQSPLGSMNNFFPGDNAGNPFPVSILIEFKFRHAGGATDSVTRGLISVADDQAPGPVYGGFARVYGFNSSAQTGLTFAWGERATVQGAEKRFTSADMPNIKDGNWHLIRAEFLQSEAGKFKSDDITVYYDDPTRSSPVVHSGGEFAVVLGNWDSSQNAGLRVGGFQHAFCHQGSYADILISNDVNDQIVLNDPPTGEIKSIVKREV